MVVEDIEVKRIIEGREIEEEKTDRKDSTTLYLHIEREREIRAYRQTDRQIDR